MNENTVAYSHRNISKILVKYEIMKKKLMKPKKNKLNKIVD